MVPDFAHETCGFDIMCLINSYHAQYFRKMFSLELPGVWLTFLGSEVAPLSAIRAEGKPSQHQCGTGVLQLLFVCASPKVGASVWSVLGVG